jgi:hypothetical protein
MSKYLKATRTRCGYPVRNLEIDTDGSGPTIYGKYQLPSGNWYPLWWSKEGRYRTYDKEDDLDLVLE